MAEANATDYPFSDIMRQARLTVQENQRVLTDTPTKGGLCHTRSASVRASQFASTPRATPFATTPRSRAMPRLTRSVIQSGRVSFPGLHAPGALRSLYPATKTTRGQKPPRVTSHQARTEVVGSHPSLACLPERYTPGGGSPSAACLPAMPPVPRVMARGDVTRGTSSPSVSFL